LNDDVFPDFSEIQAMNTPGLESSKRQRTSKPVARVQNANEPESTSAARPNLCPCRQICPSRAHRGDESGPPIPHHESRFSSFKEHLSSHSHHGRNLISDGKSLFLREESKDRRNDENPPHFLSIFSCDEQSSGVSVQASAGDRILAFPFLIGLLREALICGELGAMPLESLQPQDQQHQNELSHWVCLGNGTAQTFEIREASAKVSWLSKIFD
jgi:hypothetical protein